MESEKRYNERIRIGKRIAELRQSRGLSQNQLAELSGIKQPNLNHIEKGRYAVTLDTLTKISSALGMVVDFVGSE